MLSIQEHRIIRSTIVLLMLCGTASAQEVGTASAVNPAATANLRTITIGSSITHKTHIQTGAEGSVQLLFVDKTSMAIGPNSALTIDEYVYDPNGKTGKLAATLGKGALRFVGGQISHSGDAEIRTANAVIGIRGGTAFISPEHVYSGYGVATVNSGGTSVALRAGEFTTTEGRAIPPAPPGRPPAGFVVSLVHKFQSTGKQTGGAALGSASRARVAVAEAKASGSPKRTIVAVAGVKEGRAKTSTQSSHVLLSKMHKSSIVHSVVHSLHTSIHKTALVRKK